MNPVYSILESPHRWFILAAIALGAAFVGTIFMLAYTWPHWLARVWFYLCLAAAIILLARGLYEQRNRTDSGDASTRAGGTRT